MVLIFGKKKLKISATFLLIFIEKYGTSNELEGIIDNSGRNFNHGGGILLLGIHKFYPDQRIQKQSISETLSRIKNTYG